MTLSPFDLAVAIIIVVMMPLLMWVNYRTRESGVQGYLWRESPILMWVSLVFLGLIFLFSAVELLTHYGVLTAATEDQISMLVGIPMLLLSLAIIGMGIAAALRYMRARRSA